MKSLKLVLAFTSATAAVTFLSIQAAEALSSPPPTPAPTSAASCCAHAPASTQAARPVVGSPRGLATFPGSATPTAKDEASAHCKTTQPSHGAMSCCK